MSPQPPDPASLLAMNGRERWLRELRNGWAARGALATALALFGLILFRKLQDLS